MPRRDTTPVGHPCWIDLFTSDPDRSIAFYGELMGWEAERAGEEYGGYITFRADGDLVAGAMGNDGSEGGPDTWSVYLAVEDAAATVEAATAAGAQVVVPPMAVPDKGTMAVVVDVGGAAVGLWQAGGHDGFDRLAEPGTPGWFELHTRAYAESLEFYRDVFGWDVHTASDADDFRYSTLGREEEGAAGVMDDTVMGPDGPPAHWAVYLQVDDTDKAVARVEELGGSIEMAPEDTPHGRLAACTDPTGARFMLVG